MKITISENFYNLLQRRNDALGDAVHNANTANLMARAANAQVDSARQALHEAITALALEGGAEVGMSTEKSTFGKDADGKFYLELVETPEKEA